MAMDGPLKGIDMLLHGGDTLSHGPRNPLPGGYDTVGLAEVLNGLETPLLIAKGNCDSEVDQAVLRIPILSPYVFLYLEGMPALVLHGDGKTEADLVEMVEKFRLCLLVHGHSHIPRIRRAGDGLLVNPGTPAIPNPGGPRKKTAGTFDTATRTVTIWDIESFEPLMEEQL